ncbi:hypothetical protein Scep_010842 [Stephania cephalantha]|uniref:Chromatin assembly factor 1 subunit FAS1 n=1 Tax=Stephania cephalantha TaxID=152367 RepID=A0AAP0PHM7_9MAGN
MGDAVMVDCTPVEKKNTKSLKRKRVSSISSILDNLGSEERESRIDGLNRELDGLVRYFKEISIQKLWFEELNGSSSCSIESACACLIEGSDLPLCRLAEEIYGKVKGRDGVSFASVRNTVIVVGQRKAYGVANLDADSLEDDSEKCLWCWEVMDLKLIPMNQRGVLNIWRTVRKKIGERVNAVMAIISILQRPEGNPNYKPDLTKAYEKIAKVLAESDIRLLVEKMVKQNEADMAEKEAKLKEKKLIKELERNKRDLEKEKKRMDREHQKEMLLSEKEKKRLQDEAEREDRRREKEEAEMKRLIKKQQEEAERDQRRREREDAELKKKLSIKKQASLMERFFKIKKNTSNSQVDQPSAMEISSEDGDLCKHNEITLSMDSVLSLNDNTDTSDLLKVHMSAWKNLGDTIRSGRSRHWGMRSKPKAFLIKELKLQGTSSEAVISVKGTAGCKGATYNDELGMEKLVDGLEESTPRDSLCNINADNPSTDIQTGNITKKLLQFDKSHRPAYYGTISKRSDVIGPRHPLKKDPNLDYDVESDEEWEEEDPGESLSDCDEEETLDEANVRMEDEEGSEDGFVVPDGYLSDNEGVQVDSTESNPVDDDSSSQRCEEDHEVEEFRVFFQQQKHIRQLTQHALRKNQPLFILNLMNEKAELLTAEGLSGTPKMEQIFLQALAARPFPLGHSVDISCPGPVGEDQDVGHSQNNGSSTPVTPGTAIQDDDLPKIVWSIQACPHGINKVVESLQQKFPTIPKTHLSRKVREISDFVENRWQVKKEVLNKLGLSPSPEKCGQRTKGIAAFFSKRCLPPTAKPTNTNETSPQAPNKHEQNNTDHQACPDNRLRTNTV